MTRSDFDVVVIGGGVGALTAALFAAQHGLRTVVATDMILGGQVLDVEEIINYPGMPTPISGVDLCANIEAQALAAGATFNYERATSIVHEGGRFRVGSDSAELTARSVIVGTGSTPASLRIPGEEEYAGRGVSHCASCDAGFFRGETVAVIGSGDSAADGALVAAKSAAEVVIVAREGKLHAAASTQARLQGASRIRIMNAHEPVEIVGQNNAVTALRLRDASAGNTFDLPVSGVFIYVGLQPNTELLAPLVDVTSTGHVVTTADMETTIPGLFAIGDIRAGFAGYVVNAASDGAVAAVAALQRTREEARLHV
ncbi:NAD(P)/FAD-dependent oxidoreductase [Chelatococcus reniformis]|uniref:Thioredoxin reductase n=1 Tax=Chelatococcus reniformis TaxID=1494448 RepID=A0A916TX02_9HYPH|nr:NAD(P)/FAD-dependent oxidoreductase [Chelatococcus reniformis]GGC48678.1 thioredoxin reductase [Chelatococcus reniformis]